MTTAYECDRCGAAAYSKPKHRCKKMATNKAEFLPAYVDMIQKIMKKKGLSQSALARMAGCDPSTIHTILVTRQCSPNMVKKIDKALGVKTAPTRGDKYSYTGTVANAETVDIYRRGKAKKPVTSTVWRTFLKIDGHLLKDTPPAADSAWLMSKGIEPSAPIVLELLRDHVIPMLDKLRERSRWGPKDNNSPLTYYWFLVHNRESGVPTTEDDKAAYLDITLTFAKPIELTLTGLVPPPFVMTTPATASESVAGWNLDALEGGIEVTRLLLYRQCLLTLQFISFHKPGTDTLQLLKHLRAFLHYQANTAQMRIS